MKLTTRLVAVGAASAALLGVTVGGTASAAFPDYTGCPISAGALACVDIQNTGGFQRIKSTRVDLGTSLEIRGGLAPDARGHLGFVPPAGTDGFFSRPIRVPGGLLGIDFPIPGNEVLATAKLAGPASSIVLDSNELSVSFPMKLKLDNPILGPNCFIGSNSNPIRMNLIIGTTSPPPPNTPITGQLGRPGHTEFEFILLGNRNVDNSYSVPSASGCGLGLGLVNGLIDLKLGLPSAGGNNETQSVNNLAIAPAFIVAR